MNMGMRVDITGRINNLKLKKENGLLPLYEAIVNSIQAIDERKKSEPELKGKITVTIHRDRNAGGQIEFTPNQTLPAITGFTITDNGVGFTDENYISFHTSDSTAKIDQGCKGIGHLLWAKAFENANIHSVYINDGRKYLRDFNFSMKIANDEIPSVQNRTETDEKIQTTVKLTGFKEEYRREIKSYKRTETIADSILDHCLSYYINKSAPEITVIDNEEMGTDEEKSVTEISLYDLFSEIEDNITEETIKIRNEEFTLQFIEYVGDKANKSHSIVYCANKRSVKTASLKNIFGSKKLQKGKTKFHCKVYVSGDYLDSNVDSARNEFNIIDKLDRNEHDTLLVEDFNELTMEEIYNAISKAAEKHFGEYLKEIKELKEKEVEKYVSYINPALRFVYKRYKDKVLAEISATCEPDKITEALYKYKGQAEYENMKKIADHFNKNPAEIIDYESEIKSTYNALEENNKNCLAEYAVYRYQVLRLLNHTLNRKQNGKYSLEKELHRIFYPLNADTNSLNPQSYNPTGSNLWILDERLEFHKYVASDTTFSKSDADIDSNLRPDIIVYSDSSIKNPISKHVSIIEFKRPDRFDPNMITQIYDYINKILHDNKRSKNGRKIQTDDKTIFNCYILADLQQNNEKIKRLVSDNSLKKLSGEIGYYKYHEEYNANIYLIAYDKVISDAVTRNTIWFDRVGLPLSEFD